MKQFVGMTPNRSFTVRNAGTFIETTINQEVLPDELQEWKGRSSP
jgi:hypothetical protein